MAPTTRPDAKNAQYHAVVKQGDVLGEIDAIRARGYRLTTVGELAGSFGLLSMWYGYCTSSLDTTGAPNCALPTTLSSESDAGIIAAFKG